MNRLLDNRTSLSCGSNRLVSDQYGDGRRVKGMNKRVPFGQEEQHLLAAARSGSAEAFEKLVAPHCDALLRATRRILRNHEDAEDAVQTTLLKAWRNLDTFQGRSRFSSWITRVAVNSALMRLRASRHRNEVSIDEECQGDCPARVPVELRSNPERECSLKEDIALLEKAVNRLKPHYLEVLEMRHVQELSGIEVARILKTPANTVKARLYRARGMVMRDLQKMLQPRRRGTSVANATA